MYPDSFLNKAGSLSPDQALAIILDCRLTRQYYQILRNNSIKLNNHGCPPYEKVLKAKKMCYPENINAQGHSAEILLQSISNHTVERLCLLLKEVIQQLSSEELSKLYFKYGFNGSSGQSHYKQKFSDDNGLSIEDFSVYVSSIVPIRLVTNYNNVEKIIWTNDQPSSPKRCQAVRIMYAKETSNLISEEKSRLEKQVNNIEAHVFNIGGFTLQSTYEFISSMYDVKSMNEFTDTSYKKACNLCGLKDADLSDIEKTLNTPINTENLHDGISSLHAWIHMFD